jgi:hypothetical protein
MEPQQIRIQNQYFLYRGENSTDVQPFVISSNAGTSKGGSAGEIAVSGTDFLFLPNGDATFGKAKGGSTTGNGGTAGEIGIRGKKFIYVDANGNERSIKGDPNFAKTNGDKPKLTNELFGVRISLKNKGYQYEHLPSPTYDIERRVGKVGNEEPTATFTQIASGVSSPYNDSDVVENEDYTYKVTMNLTTADGSVSSFSFQTASIRYEEPVTAPTAEVNQLSLGTQGTTVGTIAASWDNTDTDAETELMLERYESGTWQVVNDDIFSAPAAVSSYGFDNYGDNPQSGLHRVKGRYINGAGTGPWSPYSDTYNVINFGGGL